MRFRGYDAFNSAQSFPCTTSAKLASRTGTPNTAPGTARHKILRPRISRELNTQIAYGTSGIHRISMTVESKVLGRQSLGHFRNMARDHDNVSVEGIYRVVKS